MIFLRNNTITKEVKMNNNDILTAIENKLTGNFEEDVKFILKEADHFRKLEAFDLVNEIMKTES